MSEDAFTYEAGSRREFLRRSVSASFGLTLTQWLGLSSVFAQPAAGKARSCIVLWMAGGPSQLDTWDPKPGRPTGGEFRGIETTVDGIRISEHLPKVAFEMNDLAVIRSMTSREGNHQRARISLTPVTRRRARPDTRAWEPSLRKSLRARRWSCHLSSASTGLRRARVC